MIKKHLKTNRSFTITKKAAWLVVPLVAAGGLYYPLLGLAVIGIMLAMMVLGLFKGKYWCGNICPHGSLFDFVLMRLSIFKKIPVLFRSPLLKWFFFAFFMSMFSYRLGLALGFLGETEFTTRLGAVFVNQYLVLPTIGGVILALAINPRTWCTFCPMGTLQKIMNKLGKQLNINRHTEEFITIADQESCSECGKCARVCPMQLEPYQSWDDDQFRDESCIKCYTCINNCPSELLYSTTSSDRKFSREGSKKQEPGNKTTKVA